MATGDVQETLHALDRWPQEFGLVVGAVGGRGPERVRRHPGVRDELGVTTLSELAEACGDGSLILGGPAECPERDRSASRAWRRRTACSSTASGRSETQGGPLTKAAIQQGEVSIGLVFSSDGALAQN